MVGIVGPIGSGKSILIFDIEQFSQGDTPTQRKILINRKVPDRLICTDTSLKIGHILTTIDVVVVIKGNIISQA